MLTLVRLVVIFGHSSFCVVLQCFVLRLLSVLPPLAPRQRLRGQVERSPRLRFELRGKPGRKLISQGG